MGKVLILAEKPSLAKKIAIVLGVTQKNKNRFYENDKYIVANLVGHVIQQKDKKEKWTKDILPIKIEDPIYMPSKGKEKLVKLLKSEMERTDVEEICNAGDADVEGSLLVYELIEYFNLHKGQKKLTRVWIEAEDKKTLLKSFNERYSQKEDMRYVNTGKSRNLADKRLGFNFSVLYTLLNGVYGETLPIGRVMTPTLGIVDKRQRDIDNFIPEDYYNIDADFEKQLLKMKCVVKKEDEDGILKYNTRIDVKSIEKIKKSLDTNKNFKVIEIKNEDMKKYPDHLPNATDIKTSIGKMYKYGSKKIDEIMQYLYENQFITYPRSSSKFLRTTMHEDIKKVLDNYVKIYSNEINGEKITFNVKNKRLFDDNLAKEHYAIIPMLKSKEQIKLLSQEQFNIFEYILSKFIMATMPTYQFASSNIVLENKDGVRFRISGKKEIAKGFRSFKCKVNSQPSRSDVILPTVEMGEEIKLLKYSGLEKKDIKQTKPPKKLKETDVIEMMEDIHKIYKKEIKEDDEDEKEEEDVYAEKFSLGTPATTGPLIQKLYDKKLWEKDKGGYLTLTPLGKKTVDSSNININVTANFEKKMKMITEGKIDYKEFDKEIEEWIHSIVKKEKEKIVELVQFQKEELDVECPKCKALLLSTEKTYRCSKSGKFDMKNKKWSGCGFQLMKKNTRINVEITEGILNQFIYDKIELEGENGEKLIFSLKNPPFYTQIIDKDGNINKIQKQKPEDKDGISDIGKGYKKDGIVIWKESYGRKFSKKEALKLFKGEALEFDDFVNKSGKKYKTKCLMKNKRLVLDFGK